MTAEVLGSAQCRSCGQGQPGHCAAVDTETVEPAGGALHIGQQKAPEEPRGVLTDVESGAAPLVAVAGLLVGVALGFAAGRKWR